MELTPESIRDVKFRESKRGYDPQDVDDFVDGAAALVKELENQAKEARREAQRAAEQAAERATATSDVDDTLRRTLILAQRTADAAIAEAQEQAKAMVRDAEQQSRTIRSEAEEVVRRTAAQGEEKLRREVKQLEDARNALQSDIEKLRRYMDSERTRLRGSLSEALRMIDEGISTEPAPDSTPISVPPATPLGPVDQSPADEQTAGISSWPSPGGAQTPPPTVWGSTTVSGDSGSEEDTVSSGSVSSGSGYQGGSETGMPLTESASPGPVASEEADSEDEPTAAHDVAGIGKDEPGKAPAADDSFFEELRRAVRDDAPLGPRDEEEGDQDKPYLSESEESSFFSEGDDDNRRFLRRRR